MAEDDSNGPGYTAAKIQLGGSTVQLSIDDAVSQGIYSNLQVVGNSETEFVLDFAYLPPAQPRGKVRARVILSPKHAKSLLRLLNQRVDDFESRFGPISLPATMPMKGGGSGLPN